MTDETNPAEPPAAPELEPPEPPHEPRCSFDWSSSVLNPAFLAALARAQARVQTVGKEGWNKDREYAYASSDALLGELRRAFAPEGVSFLHSWRQVAPPRMNVSDKQWLTATVIIDWVLLYGDEEKAVMGFLRGTAECEAIGSAGRPPDKAMAAAKTFAIGFVAIGIGALDRAEVPHVENVDARQEDDKARRPPPREDARERRAAPGRTNGRAPEESEAVGAGTAGADQTKRLRTAIARGFGELKLWKTMAALFEAAGVEGTQLGKINHEALVKVYKFMEESAPEPSHDSETGEVRG